VDKYLKPVVDRIVALGFQNLVPHVEMALASTEKAEDQLVLERFPQVVTALEVALTSYHEVAEGLQPPPEDDPASSTSTTSGG
jgi:hypothetical protein